MTTSGKPTPAVHLRDLPCDGRGFPVPAEAPWSDGVPNQAKVDPALKLLLAAFRSCPVCGYPLPPDEPVWRIHDEASRDATFEDLKGGLVPELDVPGHLSCMLYSALMCPFWRSPGGRLGKDAVKVLGVGKRGERPSIMGFRDYAVLVDALQPIGGPSSQPFTLVYRDFEREIIFGDPLAELPDRYDAERKRCGGRYVAKRRRHYAPQFGGERRMAKELQQVVTSLQKRAPDQVVGHGAGSVGLFVSGWL